MHAQIEYQLSDILEGIKMKKYRIPTLFHFFEGELGALRENSGHNGELGH
jgi:hypothetical protein